MDDPPRPDRVAGTCAEAFRRAGAGDVRGALRAARQARRQCDDAQSRLALGWALVPARRGAGGHAAFQAGRGRPRQGDDARPRLALGGALVRAGGGGGGYALFRAGGARPPAGAVPPLGEVALWMEDYDTARRDPRAAAELAFRTGDWSTARAGGRGGPPARPAAPTGGIPQARPTPPPGPPPPPAGGPGP